MRDPHGPSHHDVAVIYRGHQTFLQVKQEQHRTFGGEQHTSNATKAAVVLTGRVKAEQRYVP